MSPESLKIESERDGTVEIVTLARPDSRNALDVPLVEALSHYFRDLVDREEVRIVILRGEGKDYCAGLDLSQLGADDKRYSGASGGMRLQRLINSIYRHMHHAPQPVISLVQGAACGGGMSLALASDVRIAGPKARFNAAYIRIGYTGGDMGSTYFLPRLIGQSRAAEMVLTGNFLSAEEAVQAGLVSRIVADEDLLSEGMKLADDMLRNSPFGLRLTKQSLRMNTDAPSLESAMAMEDRQQILMGQTSDQKEGLKAFLEKRAPTYLDR